MIADVRTLSSMAKRSYWFGRYLERAENTARLISVNANLFIDLPVRLPLGWQPLVQITGAEQLFAQLYDAPSEQNVVHFLVSDLRNSGSLFHSLNMARENARTLRGIFPREAFEHINEASLHAKQALSEPLSKTRRLAGLSRLMEMIQQIEGFLSGNMLHDALWQFLRIGSFIERADMLTRIVDVRSVDLMGGSEPDLAPFQDIQWRSILRSLSATQSYNQVQQGPINAIGALRFLFQSEALPRSYLRCLNQVRHSLRELPRSDKPLQRVNRMRQEILKADMGGLSGKRLHAFIDQRQLELAELHGQVDRTYFSFKPRIKRSRQKRQAESRA